MEQKTPTESGRKRTPAIATITAKRLIAAHWTSYIQLKQMGAIYDESLVVNGQISTGTLIFPVGTEGYDEARRLLNLPAQTVKTLAARREEKYRIWGDKARKQKGRRLWKKLHEWALVADLSDRAGIDKWLADFTAEVPCGACQRHWRELLVQVPPDLFSNEALFIWSVTVHNIVNDRIGNAIVPWDVARTLYGKGCCDERGSCSCGEAA